jgi:type I restriction enzyme S subunit
MAYVQLGDICNIIKGEIGITKAIPGDFPMVTTGEFRKSHNKYQLDTKAVLVPLVSATGHGHASIKRIHYQEGKFAFGSILAACIPKDKTYSAKFLYIYFNLMKDYVLVPLMKGSANVSLTLGNLRTAKVPDISLKTQLKIVDLYSEIKIEQDKAADLLINQKNDINALRLAILEEGVRGKLSKDWRESNSTSEDASILLKRIQKEKVHLLKNKEIRNEKPLPPIIKEEIPYELPNGWVWCRLGDTASSYKRDIIDGPFGSNLKATEYVQSGIPIIRLQNIARNKFLFKSIKYITQEKAEFLQRHNYDYGDVVICKLGSPTGKACIIPLNMKPGRIVADIVRYRVNDSVLFNEYLSYSLNAPTTVYQFASEATGITRQRVNLSKIRELVFALPPLEEQKIIAKKMKDLLGFCDEIEQQTQQTKKDIEQLMQSVLREVFEGEKSI